MVKVVDDIEDIKKVKEKVGKLEKMARDILPSDAQIRLTEFNYLVLNIPKVNGEIKVGFDRIALPPRILVTGPELYTLAYSLATAYEKAEGREWELHTRYPTS